MGDPSGNVAELSVVFAARGGFANTRKGIECLLGQSISPRIELIVVSDSPELLREIECFVMSSERLARCDFLLHLGEDLADDRIRGVTKATAPLVVFAEDHAFPDRNWAEEMVAAFRSSPHVLAAAPVLLNPNPESAVSRAQWFLTHGLFERGGPADRFEGCEHLPWHATAYRSEMLMAEIGGGHVDLFRAEAFLQEKLCQAHPAGRLVRCMRTRTNHFNMSRLCPALLLAFHGGRIFGAVRAKRSGWGLAASVARSSAFPLIALLKVLRTAPILWDRSSWLRTAAHVPVALLLAFVHAMGEAVGTCFGMGTSAGAYAKLEYNRVGCLLPAERQLLVSTAEESPATVQGGVGVTDESCESTRIGEGRT